MVRPAHEVSRHFLEGDLIPVFNIICEAFIWTENRPEYFLYHMFVACHYENYFGPHDFDLVLKLIDTDCGLAMHFAFVRVSFDPASFCKVAVYAPETIWLTNSQNMPTLPSPGEHPITVSFAFCIDPLKLAKVVSPQSLPFRACPMKSILSGKLPFSMGPTGTNTWAISAPDFSISARLVENSLCISRVISGAIFLPFNM
jgi:hypothetical protein